MNLHEFQAKPLLSGFAIPSPEGRVAMTADEAEAAAHALKGDGAPLLVKAQILAGERAISGGIRFASNAAEVRNAAATLLGRRLVTPQTGPAGALVKRVLVERGIAVARELYLTMALDGAAGTILLLGADAGGGDIEARERRGEVALQRLAIGTTFDVAPATLDAFCRGLGLDGQQAERCGMLIRNLHRAFVEIDASLIELNPLALTASGDFVALDTKVVLDDNALFRHPALAALRDADDIDEVELKAERHQVNFMQMDGDIGLVVNGAGLGLATLDMVREAGGRPCNFMDIRTTAKSLDIAQGIGLVLDNPRAKVLLVNVYGGGMQPCDTIVEGLGIAVRRKGRVLPIVLRLTGNNEDLARLRLANFNLPVTECAHMGEAVTKAVALAQGRMQ
jgi:succinyl-CoA synthetase beta subunit